MSRTPRSRRARLIGAGVILLLVGVSCVALRLLPIASEGEVEEAERWHEGEREALASMRCPRPTLRGPSVPGDAADDARALLEPSACLDTVEPGRLRELFTSGQLGERAWAWDIPEAEVAPALPIASLWIVLGTFVPPFPADALPPEVAAIEAACADLPGRVRAVIAHEEACTPFDAEARAPSLDQSRRLRQLPWALAVLARRRVAAGDAAGGLALLLDGIRLMHDLRRGPAPVLWARSTVAAESVLWSELQTMLNLALDLDEDARARLRGRLVQLAETLPHPSHTLRAETVDLVTTVIRPLMDGESPEGTTPASMPTGDGETGGRAMFVATPDVAATIEAACPAESSLTECYQGVQALSDAPPAELPPRWVFLALGERLSRGYLTETFESFATTHLASHVWNLLRPLVHARTFAAVLTYGAAREEGGCPGADAFDPSELRVPELDLALTFEPLAAGSQYEVHLTGALFDDPSPVSRPAALLLCPSRTVATAGHWIDP